MRSPSLGSDAAFVATGLPIPVVNDLEQECFVFEKKAYSDVIWQARNMGYVLRSSRASSTLTQWTSCRK